MKSFFSWLTTVSLRFRALTFALAVLILVLGVVAYTDLNQELLPPLELPQTIILAQAGGLTSEQALTLLTQRLEAQVSQIDEVINLESTTNGAIGSVLTAYNDFGIDAEGLRADIREALDAVWLPQRRIAPPEGESGSDFAARLLNELTAEDVVFLAQNDPNFLFQLTPEVWAALSDETVRAAAAFLADRLETATAEQSALERLVESEIAPQLSNLTDVANVVITGGQALPGEQVNTVVSETEATEPQSQLLSLSPEAWAVISEKIDAGQLNAETVAALQAENVPTVALAPALPESWQMDSFRDASDLLEVIPFTSSLADVLNDFYGTGRITGALGTTEDLTPEIVTQLLEIEPTMVDYLEADQLVAMSPEVFAVLPAEFIASLDGFTRDALAAAALAETITGQTAERQPVQLPIQWRIQQPQLITFSFADIPLATFTIASTGTQATEAPAEQPEETASTFDPTALAPIFAPLANLFGGGGSDDSPVLGDAWNVLAAQPQFAATPLRTAADVIAIGNGQASAVLNNINANVPAGFEGYEVRLFDSLTPDILAYFASNEPDFYTNLDTNVLRKFSADVLNALPEDVIASLDEATAAEVQAIASGEQESAFATLAASLYTSDVTPADPSAPALNPQWQTIVPFLPGVQALDNAFDLFRFPDAIGTPAAFINSLFDNPQGSGFAPALIGNMSPEAVTYIAERDPNFLTDLRPEALVLFSDEVKATLPEEIRELAESGAIFTPTDQVTRTNRAPSLLLTVYKTRQANTVAAFHEVEDIMAEIDAANDDIAVGIAFEQSSFIEESISGVAREGGLGAVFAIVCILVFLSGGLWNRSPRRIVGVALIVVFAGLMVLLVVSNLGATNNDVGAAFARADVVIRVLLLLGIAAGLFVLLWPGNLPYPSWRATIIIAISLPLSVMAALALMHWFSPFMHGLISPLAENSGFFRFLVQLFPEQITLNIMTLSGLTVAVGRVVDDSIVVLENIFRQMQTGMNKRDAIITGTRDVSTAIFVATLVTVVVFLPLGLTGGIIGAFFLPFGLAVTFALLSSFVVAVTVIPVLAYLFLGERDAIEEGEMFLTKPYDRALRWVLASPVNGLIVIAIAFASLFFSALLFSGRPFAFLPSFGEPQISVAVNMPGGTRLPETNALVEELEVYLEETISEETLTTVQSTIGGSGLTFESLLSGGGVSENTAAITVGVEAQGSELDELAQQVRAEAERIFGEGNVTVSAASLSDSGFGGFSLVVSGGQEDLERLDPIIIETLNSIDGITNASSNLSAAAAAGADGPVTYIRVNQQQAVSYTAELETENTIGVTQEAIAAIEALPDLPDNISISQGFQSELQTEGFRSLGLAIVIALAIVIVIMILTFSSVIYWLAIILSVAVAPVGAAIALTLTDRVLGISALIGLLMLLGLVVTNAVVLIDRVRANLIERHMPVREALIEAGERRLRPILMTSIATIFALVPLAIGLSEGAIIASELGTVVIGGMFSSTLLTLIVVPAAYLLLSPIHRALAGLVGVRGSKSGAQPTVAGD
ncbi:MAG: efflux RND transporter permease subunit [bacterium]|nr:efflux RND transporter permease subunit [bacterium]